MDQLRNPIETLKVLNFLKTAYPKYLIDLGADRVEETFRLYVQMLNDIDPNELKAAVLQHVAESRFFPTVAELRERVLALRQTAAQIPGWEQAWDELMRNVKRYGFEDWEHARFSTPLVREVAKSFWFDACRGDVDNLPTVRAQFRDTYNTRAKRMADNQRLLPATREYIKRLADNLDAGRRLLNGGTNADHD